MNGSTTHASKLPWRQKVRRFLSTKESIPSSPPVIATAYAANVVSSPSDHVTSVSATGSGQPTSAQNGSPNGTPTVNLAGSASASSVTSPGATDVQFLQLALQSLDDGDRTILGAYVSSAASDIHRAVQGALTAAEGKRRTCIEKRWSFSVRGRNVVFREEADKLVHWLNRFKAVGDIIANVDPVHVGLPWAGIRLLLEAAVADSKQMAALLIGCEMALYVASRLNAYLEFWRGLPSALASNNLKESIVTLYAHILRFLAHAIRTYEASTTRRYFSAFWELDDVLNFEKKANDLALKVEIDASNCDRLLAGQERKLVSVLQSKMEKALTDLQQYHQLQISLDQLNLKIDLGKIPYAKGAIFNSFDDVHTLCHPLTRGDLLDQVQSWARRPDSKSIFWLHGAAGAGKSTISWTISQWLADQHSLGGLDLGASFFFKRGEGDRGSAERFFPTIVRQLILKIPGLDVVVAKVIASDPFIFDKAIAEQFRRLLLEPLQDPILTGRKDSTLVVVVDALDECDQEIHIQTVLEMWPQLLTDTPFTLRLFLTSRPELAIRLEFQQMSEDMFRHIDLVDAVPVNTIQHDLSIYLLDTLRSIRDVYNDRFRHNAPISSSWPEDKTIKQLSDMANPLFIVAATVCRFVGDLEFNPRESLEEILKTRNIGQMSQMELTYLPVLKHLTNKSRDQRHTDKLYQEFRAVVGAIVVLAEPLSVNSLGILLGIPLETIDRRLAPLHSVLRVPSDHHTPVRTLHLSFAEFLLGEKAQQQPFGVDAKSMHWTLGKQCLKLLSGPGGLCENICGLQHPGQPRHELQSSSIEQRISPALQYASRYWISHIQFSSHEVRDNDEIHRFMQKHFFHWLEVLSLTNRISEAVADLNALRSCVSTASSPLRGFLEDARRFVLANRSIIDLAPLQIYSSATIFAPQDSVVCKSLGRIPTWVQQYPTTAQGWGSVLQKLEGHEDGVGTVAFCPGSSILASGSGDKTIRLWDAQTGQEIQKLEGHTGEVADIAISSDGALLVSSSRDRTIRLWDVRTGQDIMELDSCSDRSAAIAISPDNSIIASASGHEQIRLWDVQTGDIIRIIEGENQYTSVVAFSPDGSVLASNGASHTIQLWNAQTGQDVLKLEGHSSGVNAIAFSPDGNILASSSGDATIRLWNIQSGQQFQKLEGHLRKIAAITFSPNGSVLASASWDETVCIWDTNNWQRLQTFDDHTDGVYSLSFSSDGTILASGSCDETIRLWDMQTSSQASTHDGHLSAINAILFSHNGGILASASSDKTIRLWNPSTGLETQKLEGHTGEVNAIALSPDDSLLASGGRRCIRLWDFKSGQELAKFEGHNREITVLQFSPDGTILASGSGDEMIQLWNPQHRERLRELEGHTGKISALAFSSDSKLLASASRDTTIKIWDVHSGLEIREIEVGMGKTSRSIKFALDDKTLITDLGTFSVEEDGNSDDDDDDIGNDDDDDGKEKPNPEPSETTLLGTARLTMSGEWIVRDGKKLLWVPHEYRGVSALHGDRLAIGGASGFVSFFRFGDIEVTA